jgi:hypothetical protein
LKSLYFVLCASTAIAVSYPALALDAADFAAKFSSAYGTVGYELQFGPVQENGNDISFNGLTISPVGSGEEPTKIDTVFTFSGVEQREDGGYTAESLTVPDIDIDRDGFNISAQNVEATNIYVPAKAEGGMIAMMQMFSGFSARPIAVSMGEKQLFALASVKSTSTFSPEQGVEALDGVSTEASFDGIAGSIGEEMGVTKDVIDALGLDAITGNMRESMDWTMADGRMNIGEFSLTLDNLGKVNLGLDFSGYTPELLNQMTASQAEIAKLSPQEQTARQEQMGMEMAGKLSIFSLSLRYDDASLTNKLLDYFAAQQGISRTEFVGGLKIIAPAMLAQAGSPALVEQVKAAIGTFFDNPQSLEISIDPGRAVNFMELAALAANPDALVSSLNFQISANQPTE